MNDLFWVAAVVGLCGALVGLIATVVTACVYQWDSPIRRTR